NQNALNYAEEYLGEDEDDDAVCTSSESNALNSAEEYLGNDEDDDAVDTSSGSNALNSAEEYLGEDEDDNAAKDGKQDRSFMENFRSALAQNIAAASIAASSMFTP